MNEREYAEVHLVYEDGVDVAHLAPGHKIIVNMVQTCEHCDHCMSSENLIDVEELRYRYEKELGRE